MVSSRCADVPWFLGSFNVVESIIGLSCLLGSGSTSSNFLCVTGNRKKNDWYWCSSCQLQAWYLSPGVGRYPPLRKTYAKTIVALLRRLCLLCTQVNNSGSPRMWTYTILSMRLLTSPRNVSRSNQTTSCMIHQRIKCPASHEYWFWCKAVTQQRHERSTNDGRGLSQRRATRNGSRQIELLPSDLSKMHRAVVFQTHVP